jgi:hypothetical protein
MLEKFCVMDPFLDTVLPEAAVGERMADGWIKVESPG